MSEVRINTANDAKKLRCEWFISDIKVNIDDKEVNNSLIDSDNKAAGKCFVRVISAQSLL